MEEKEDEEEEIEAKLRGFLTGNEKCSVSEWRLSGGSGLVGFLNQFSKGLKLMEAIGVV